MDFQATSVVPQMGGMVVDSHAPAKETKDKICDYYLTPRGCIKGTTCDFKHPVAPNGTVTTKVCEYFNSNRGCVKGTTCDFLHLPPQVASRVGTKPGFGMMGALPQMLGAAAMPRSAAGKVCEFFNSPRGCVKGQTCDFAHIPANQGNPMQMHMQQHKPFLPPQVAAVAKQMFPPTVTPLGLAKKPFICEYFGTERGCVKGDLCDFIHQKPKVCEFYNTPRGCKKNNLCDFQHPAKDGETPGVDPRTQRKVRAGNPSKPQRFQPY